MTVKVGINGFGRIGRTFLRSVLERDMEVVAINDVAPIKSLAHLLAYDSTFGRLKFPVHYDANALLVDRKPIAVTTYANPADIAWGELGADVVIEATGRFRSRDDAAAHLKAGARKVLISAPGKDVDLTVVMGVNHGEYDPMSHDIISNASCTTNCVVPLVKVLQDHFGIVKGTLTTVHGYMNDQVVLDSPHKDPRRSRSAAVNIIPTTSGAAQSIGEVIPALAGRLDGVALRVPVEDASLVDLTVLLEREVSAGEVNEAFRHAAGGDLVAILKVTADPIVSRDVVGESASCVIDEALTTANGELVKVFGWYDNEWAYTQRIADLAEYVGHRL